MPFPADPAKGLTLQEWLEASELTYSAFARLVPCSTSYPRLLAHGLARPSYELAVRIEDLTGGLVPRTTWYPAGEQRSESQPFNMNEIEELIHARYTNVYASCANVSVT